MSFEKTTLCPVRQRVRDHLTSRRLTCLLMALLLLFLGSACQNSHGMMWVKLILTLTLAAGLSVVTSRQRWREGALLAVPALVANWLNVLTHLHSRPLMLIEGGFSILFLAYTVWVILTFVFAETDVTLDTINGSLCVYLLLGFIWALGYGMIERLAPGSFTQTVKGLPGSRSELAQPEHLFPLAYYSFMTITSVGYGDIVPVATAARALSALEAVVGQIYLVVLVARLVGIHTAQQVERWQRPRPVEVATPVLDRGHHSQEARDPVCPDQSLRRARWATSPSSSKASSPMRRKNRSTPPSTGPAGW